MGLEVTTARIRTGITRLEEERLSLLVSLLAVVGTEEGIRTGRVSK